MTYRVFSGRRKGGLTKYYLDKKRRETTMEKKDYIEYLEKEHKKAKEQGKILEYQGICVSVLIEELNELKNCNFIKLRDDLAIPKDKIDELVEKLEVLEIIEKKEVNVEQFKLFLRQYGTYKQFIDVLNERQSYKEVLFSHSFIDRKTFNKLKNYFERKK